MKINPSTCLLLVAAAGSPAGAYAAAPATAPAATAPIDVEHRIDLGLEQLSAKKYEKAAALFFDVYQALPDSDLHRDMAEVDLAEALVAAGFTQAGVDHYVNVVGGRRSPALMNKALGALKQLYEDRLVEEDRLVDGVVYGSQFGELSPDIADFVEYLQAMTDVRRGFRDWGTKRLEALSHTSRPYAFAARYALAVERIARREDDAAEAELRTMLKDAPAQVPGQARNRARLALARQLYEKKDYAGAWEQYRTVDSPLPLMDIVLLEEAWDRVAIGDEQRALGMVVGLGAPVFRELFAPERYLIRAMAFRRLCQYRAASLAVADFRKAYGPLLADIRNGVPLRASSILRKWATTGTDSLAAYARVRSMLSHEQSLAGSVSDPKLKAHLAGTYATSLARFDGLLARGSDSALERAASELLRVDEKMNLIVYETAAGLFKPDGETAEAPHALRASEVPYGSSSVYFKFDGEYWSDELASYMVLSEDRCLR